MEDTLRVKILSFINSDFKVLILIIMEDTLRACVSKQRIKEILS